MFKMVSFKEIPKVIIINLYLDKLGVFHIDRYGHGNIKKFWV